jgi:DNA-binding NtrC family response regulator
LGREPFDISPEALAALEAYPWPGNIRELDNVMRQATLLSLGAVLLSRHLPDWVRKGAAETAPPATAPRRPLGSEREAAEKGLIRRVLADHGQSRTRAARELGISRMTLYQKMKKYGLARA